MNRTVPAIASSRPNDPIEETEPFLSTMMWALIAGGACLLCSCTLLIIVLALRRRKKGDRSNDTPSQMDSDTFELTSVEQTMPASASQRHHIYGSVADASGAASSALESTDRNAVQYAQFPTAEPLSQTSSREQIYGGMDVAPHLQYDRVDVDSGVYGGFSSNGGFSTQYEQVDAPLRNSFQS